MKKAVFVFIFAIGIISQVLSDEIDEVRELLATEEGGEILFLSKINLGIPGGDNWIANRSDGWTYIYTINDDKEIKCIDIISIPEISRIQFWDFNINSNIDLEYDIMQGIPGTQLGSKAAKFGNFNGNDRDGIFLFLTAVELSCSILEYNIQKGERLFLLSSRFNFISPRGPTPVFFANYQGRDGILVCTMEYRVEKYIWNFFVWDENSQEYLRLVRIWEDEIDYSAFPNVRKKGDNQNISEPVAESVVPVVESEQPESDKEFAANSGKNSGLNLYIVIAAGVIALGAVMVFVVVKRKKKHPK